MLKKIILAAGTAAVALGASSAAFAHDDHGRGWGHHHYAAPHFAARRVVVAPAPRVVFSPSPRVAYPYYAAPVVVRSAPVVVAPAPVYSAPGVSIRLDFPL
jgi:hypothetical protein